MAEQPAAKAGAANPNYRGGFASTCSACGKAVWVKPSRASRPQRFCSKPCASRWMAENTRAEAHWRFQGGPVRRTCEACGVGFDQRRAEFNRSPARFCSGGCSAADRRRRVEKVCEVCDGGFTVKAHKTDARFCSRKCKRLSQIKERTEEEIARLRINKSVTSIMASGLKGKKRGCRWVVLVGYSLDDLMRRLESLFQPGMTWGNYGRWHVDHIRPRSSFSYSDTTDPEFKACWALTNLQPLWAIDNLRKGAKYPNPESTEPDPPCSTPT